MKNRLTRVTIEISEAQKKKLRVLAALYDMTVKELILDRTIGSEPNKETLKSFRDYENNVNITRYKNLEDLWKDLKI